MRSLDHCKVGDPVPKALLYEVGADGLPCTVHTGTLFPQKRVLVVSFPGAYTPTCSNKHLPGFEHNFRRFQQRGIEAVYAIGVNDPFVLQAWSVDIGCSNIRFLSDATGEFTQRMGFLYYYEKLMLGFRPRRYAAVVSNGFIEHLFIDSETEHQLHLYGATDAEAILKHIWYLIGLLFENTQTLTVYFIPD